MFLENCDQVHDRWYFTSRIIERSRFRQLQRCDYGRSSRKIIEY